MFAMLQSGVKIIPSNCNDFEMCELLFL